MSAGCWIVAQTKSQQEKWAAENVARQGFELYLPLTLAKAAPNKPPRPVCLFPRYLFVRVGAQWHSLRGTYGVTGLIMSGEIPAVVPESAVEALRSREGVDGLICLPTITPSGFKAGEALRINGGYFSGYSGVCVGMASTERVRILLDFLGRKSPVLVPKFNVERV